MAAVQAALAAGGNSNERDANSWTPLMLAALQCRAQIAGLLLEHRVDARAHGSPADPASLVSSRQTALLLAAGCFINRRRAQLAPERHMPPDYAAYELAASARLVIRKCQAARGLPMTGAIDPATERAATDSLTPHAPAAAGSLRETPPAR